MYFRRKSLEDIPKEETVVWTCKKSGCNVWMRDNFAFDTVPTCWECNSPMTKSVKLLPQLVNSNDDLKSLKKNTKIS